MIVTPVSPFSEDADQHTVKWSGTKGLVRSESTERHLAETRPGLLAAHCYPTAGRKELRLLADWMSWLFLLDDQVDESGHRIRPGALEAELAGVVRTGLRHPSPDGGALGYALGDILDRLEHKDPSGGRWMLRFHHHLLEYLTACVWQATHRAVGDLLSEETYPEMRRRAGAIMPSFDLVEIACGNVLDPAVYYSKSYQRLLISAANVVCWTNDVMTWEKEAQLGDPHNLVLLTSTARDMPIEQAVAHVVAEADREVGRFLAAERELAPECREALAGCVASLRAWMRGHVDWGRKTVRYSGITPPHVEELFAGQATKGHL